MKDIVGKILNEIKTNRIKLRRMRRILLVLSLLVATAVVWQLKITGITMTGEALCGYLEHRHTESCLRTVEICGLQETDGHSHGTDCYKVLRCTEEVHDHGDACYETVELPVCGKKEAEEHHHSEECLQESYICGYQQEHAHSPLCYSNLEADLESSSDWEKTIPALIQDPAADLAAVARSQLGYMESQQNYKLADDRVTQMGYTRYGEWYGNPYGKWNAMFVSFCLHYAEHPAYETLKNSGVEGMRLAAEDSGVYHGVSGTVPGVGDLVFLDKDGNGTCETVAIVSVCEEGGAYLVEGDCDGVVAENRYVLDDSAIVGYAILTAQPETTEELVEEAPKATKAADNPPEDNEVIPAAEDGITVTFEIKKPEYTDDPGNHTTHLTVESTDGLTADGGLTYTAWEGTDKYKVIGNGTLASFTLPAETAFAGNGYAFPTVKVENMTPEEGRQYTYASAYNWVTETGLICNEKTVFPESTTLYLCLYESGKTCGLNWVCNCDAGGTHSITSYVSGFGSPVFTWEQSLSEPYIPTAAAVNSGYTGSQFCTAGPDYGMQLKGWYVKDAAGNEFDFSADTPILESYKDKDSNGYSVKIYARWEKTEQNIETVTATFVNGQEMVTVSLNKGDALSDKLPAVTPPEGKVFVGWQIGDTTDYATAETVIAENTTYTAVFADNVTVTFMNNGEPYGEAVTVPEGTPLWGYLPTQEPEYSGDGDTPMIFAGWKIGDTDNLVKEDTLAEADMVLYAVFAEVPNYKVYMHDIAPDGKTDYETQGGNVSTDRLLPEGSTLAQYLEENDFFMHHDDARASSCKWYTEQEQEGAVTYVPYDLQSPITSELHLYTFNYSVTLTLQEEVATTSFLNLFPVASAAEVEVNGNTLTLTLREGEKPTPADFVKGEVDYSVYNWSFKDGSGNELELTLADILKNGVTGNITATSSEDDRAIVATDTAKVRFQVIVNNELKDLGQQDVTVYKLNEIESYSISQETLKEVYRDFGFSVEQWVANRYSCPQMVDGTNSKYWADTELRLANGLYYNPSVGKATSGSSVLYLPTNDEKVEGEDWTKYTPSQSFYTVTISDPEGIVYSDQSKIPDVQYVFTGKNATVTVPSPTGISWKYTGINATDTVNVTETDNGDGTKTLTVANVTTPIVLTPVYDGSTNAEKNICFYVYVDNKRVLVESGTYPVYAYGSKHYVSASLLEKVYDAYGFTADQLNSTDDRYFPHTHEGGGTVYTDADPEKRVSGMWFSPILNANDPRNCDVYYAPGFTGTDSAQTSLLASDYSFYTVTVTDPENLVYGTDEKMPDAKIVFTENNASVTVKTSGRESITVEGGRYYWMVNGEELTNGVPNDDGTVTFTIADVQEPLVLTPERNFVNVIVEDDNSLIYTAEEPRPREQVLKGETATITVRCPSGYGWIANGRSIPGGVSGENAVTYTFANLTEDVLLTPVLPSYTIHYNLNLNQYAPNPSNQAPQIEVTSEAYAGGENPYPVRTPNRLEYTTTGTASYKAVVFDGWIPEGNQKLLLGKEDMLTLAYMAALDANGDGTINLTAKWTNLGFHGSVSFYVNLELRVADYAGSAEDTGNKNYTDVLYGTGVTITPLPGDAETMYADINVLQAAGEAATAEIDANVRKLAADGGVEADFMGEKRCFKLNSFPKDEYILETVRAKQTEYLAAYNAWLQNGEDQNGDGSIDADDYRSKTGQKIIEIDGKPIPVKDINPDNYTIRWYVFKYERIPDENGWHIDGVLVKKQAQLTVTKTFYGDTAAVAEVKKNYTIDVVGIDNTADGIDKKPTLYTLTLNSQTTQQDQEDTEGIEQGYTDYDPTTDTYTWVVNLTADWDAWLYERDYTYAQDGIVTLSEYLSYNFTNTGYNQVRTKYRETEGVQVAVKAHGVDQDYTTFETVSFYNTYLPSAAVLISKIDDTGKPLTGVSFTLSGTLEDTAVPATIYQDTKGVYHYRPDSTQGDLDHTWSKVDYITVDKMGYALVMGLKDKSLNYSFELVEATAPEGYTSIGVPIAFYIDESGIHLTQNSAASSPDGHTIHVTNTSKMTSVKAVKQWNGETNKKVTLQLLLDDTPLPGKVVELDGIVDTTADGMTDGYESEAWTVVWKNLPAYTGGSPAVYRIKETWIGDSAYSGDIDDGYENYDVQYAKPEYDTTGDVPTVILKVTNQVATTEVELRKVDHRNEGLPGATFRLYFDEACTAPYGNAVTSGESGRIYFGKLAAGTYYLKETDEPDGYYENDTIYELTVTGSGRTLRPLNSESPIPAVIQNNPIPVSLNIHKVDGEGHPLTGADFELYMRNSDGGYGKIDIIIDNKPVNWLPVDGDGKLTIPDLLPGEYKLVEVHAPAGYYRMTEDVFFTVVPGGISCEGSPGIWTFDGETNTVTVVNVAGSELPQTGGMGTHYGTMAGLLMMAGSLLYGFLLRRKRERGTA